jgi:hypothetical protein
MQQGYRFRLELLVPKQRIYSQQEGGWVGVVAALRHKLPRNSLFGFSTFSVWTKFKVSTGNKSGSQRGMALDPTPARASSEQVWDPMASSSVNFCRKKEPYLGSAREATSRPVAFNVSTQCKVATVRARGPLRGMLLVPCIQGASTEQTWDLIAGGTLLNSVHKRTQCPYTHSLFALQPLAEFMVQRRAPCILPNQCASTSNVISGANGDLQCLDAIHRCELVRKWTPERNVIGHTPARFKRAVEASRRRNQWHPRV